MGDSEIVAEFTEQMERERDHIAYEFDLPNLEFAGIGMKLDEGFLIGVFTLGPFDIVRTIKPFGYAVSCSPTEKCSEGHAEYLEGLLDVNGRRLFGKGLRNDEGSSTIYEPQEFWDLITVVREMRVCSELMPIDVPHVETMPRAETLSAFEEAAP